MHKYQPVDLIRYGGDSPKTTNWDDDKGLMHHHHHNVGFLNDLLPFLNRKYFGEQIGFYFAWLGVYTQLLIPPSVLGIIVFLYGIFTVDTNVPR